MATKLIITFHILTLFLFANEQVSLQLQWKYQFQFAGYIMAKEKGFYNDVGLDVDIKEWQHGIDIPKNVMENETTFSIVRSTAFVDDSNKDDIVFIAALFQSSPIILLADKSSGIKNFKDLKDKKIMVTNDLASEASLIAMLFSQKSSFEQMNHIKQTFKVEDLLNGKADLLAGYISNEPFVLEKLGGEPVIFNPKKYGFNFYSDILVTNRKNLDSNPKEVENFTHASLKGWEYAFDNIEETAQILFEKYNSLNKSKEALIYEGKELKKLAYEDTDELGLIKKERLERIYDVYKLLGISKTKLFFDEDMIYKRKIHNTQLTKSEKSYIKDKEIVKVCTNPNWAPIEFTNNQGEPNGISIDMLKLIGEKSGLKFEFIKTKDWGESQQFLKEKKCDILPAAIKTKQREKYANFTTVHTTYNLAIVTKKDKPLVDNIEQIIDKTISRKEKSGLISKLKELYPNINIKETSGYKEAFEAVANNDTYFTIATLPVLSYYKNLYKFDSLQIAGYSGIKYDLCIVVRDDDFTLLNILNKMLLSISDESKKIISEKWLSKNYEKDFDYSLLRNISIVIFILFLFFIYKQYMLKKSLDEVDEIINATIEGIVIFKDNIAIDVNQSCVDILGYDSKKQLIGKDIFSFVPKDLKDAAKDKLDQKTTLPYEFPILKKDNSTISALVKERYIKNRAIHLISFVDITLLKQQEQQLFGQAKLVSMGEMIGNIAHQWRQPLSVISTSATGIKVQKEYGVLEDEFLLKACDAIDNNVQYLSKTIDDFRDFVKGERIKSKFKATDFVQSLLNLIEPSIKNHNINIVQDIEQDILIDGYKNELLQCFMNIYSNARDALEKKENLKLKIISFTIKKEKNNIVLSFLDNGGGIKEDIIDKIFEPYFTTKSESQGTGLGLHMTYNLITKGMLGTIEVQNNSFEYKSEKYFGAEFVITLPLSQ